MRHSLVIVLPETATLLFPRKNLAGCIYSAIVRDTRTAALGDLQRFNHFPASPLIALTVVLEGETRLTSASGGLAAARRACSLPPVTVSGPQNRPLTSWNPGPVLVVSIGLYPDAWMRLTGVLPEAIADQTSPQAPQLFEAPVAAILEPGDMMARWRNFQDALEPLWRTARSRNGPPVWDGAHSIGDWSRSLVAKSATSGAGRSLRSAERRLRRWAGHGKRALALYARIDDLHRISKSGEAAASLASIATEAGYADQSHMARAVRRTTGCSPARLNRLIDTEEAFWCYRLLGERF